eukprot:13826432-Ditylum_brightwellii.AAC.1
MTTSDWEDRKIIFKNRAGAKIADIKLSDKYKDWPADAKLTGVALQMTQDCQEMVNSYVADNKEDYFNPAQEDNPTKMNPELCTPDLDKTDPETGTTENDPELGPPPPLQTKDDIDINKHEEDDNDINKEKVETSNEGEADDNIAQGKEVTNHENTEVPTEDIAQEELCKINRDNMEDHKITGVLDKITTPATAGVSGKAEEENTETTEEEQDILPNNKTTGVSDKEKQLTWRKKKALLFGE